MKLLNTAAILATLLVVGTSSVMAEETKAAPADSGAATADASCDKEKGHKKCHKGKKACHKKGECKEESTTAAPETK